MNSLGLGKMENRKRDSARLKSAPCSGYHLQLGPPASSVSSGDTKLQGLASLLQRPSDELMIGTMQQVTLLPDWPDDGADKWVKTPPHERLFAPPPRTPDQAKRNSGALSVGPPPVRYVSFGYANRSVPLTTVLEDGGIYGGGGAFGDMAPQQPVPKFEMHASVMWGAEVDDRDVAVPGGSTLDDLATTRPNANGNSPTSPLEESWSMDSHNDRDRLRGEAGKPPGWKIMLKSAATKIKGIGTKAPVTILRRMNPNLALLSNPSTPDSLTSPSPTFRHSWDRNLEPSIGGSPLASSSLDTEENVSEAFQFAVDRPRVLEEWEDQLLGSEVGGESMFAGHAIIFSELSADGFQTNTQTDSAELRKLTACRAAYAPAPTPSPSPLHENTSPGCGGAAETCHPPSPENDCQTSEVPLPIPPLLQWSERKSPLDHTALPHSGILAMGEPQEDADYQAEGESSGPIVDERDDDVGTSEIDVSCELTSLQIRREDQREESKKSLISLVEGGGDHGSYGLHARESSGEFSSSISSVSGFGSHGGESSSHSRYGSHGGESSSHSRYGSHGGESSCHSRYGSHGDERESEKGAESVGSREDDSTAERGLTFSDLTWLVEKKKGVVKEEEAYPAGVDHRPSRRVAVPRFQWEMEKLNGASGTDGGAMAAVPVEEAGRKKSHSWSGEDQSDTKPQHMRKCSFPLDTTSSLPRPAHPPAVKQPTAEVDSHIIASLAEVDCLVKPLLAEPVTDVGKSAAEVDSQTEVLAELASQGRERSGAEVDGQGKLTVEVDCHMVASEAAMSPGSSTAEEKYLQSPGDDCELLRDVVEQVVLGLHEEGPAIKNYSAELERRNSIIGKATRQGDGGFAAVEEGRSSGGSSPGGIGGLDELADSMAAASIGCREPAEDGKGAMELGEEDLSEESSEESDSVVEEGKESARDDALSVDVKEVASEVKEVASCEVKAAGVRAAGGPRRRAAEEFWGVRGGSGSVGRKEDWWSLLDLLPDEGVGMSAEVSDASSSDGEGSQAASEAQSMLVNPGSPRRISLSSTTASHHTHVPVEKPRPHIHRISDLKVQTKHLNNAGNPPPIHSHNRRPSLDSLTFTTRKTTPPASLPLNAPPNKSCLRDSERSNNPYELTVRRRYPSPQPTWRRPERPSIRQPSPLRAGTWRNGRWHEVNNKKGAIGGQQKAEEPGKSFKDELSEKLRAAAAAQKVRRAERLRVSFETPIVQGSWSTAGRHLSMWSDPGPEGTVPMYDVEDAVVDPLQAVKKSAPTEKPAQRDSWKALGL